jgi:hypothetical protein
VTPIPGNGLYGAHFQFSKLQRPLSPHRKASVVSLNSKNRATSPFRKGRCANARPASPHTFNRKWIKAANMPIFAAKKPKTALRVDVARIASPVPYGAIESKFGGRVMARIKIAFADMFTRDDDFIVENPQVDLRHGLARQEARACAHRTPIAGRDIGEPNLRNGLGLGRAIYHNDVRVWQMPIQPLQNIRENRATSGKNHIEAARRRGAELLADGRRNERPRDAMPLDQAANGGGTGFIRVAHTPVWQNRSDSKPKVDKSKHWKSNKIDEAVPLGL